MKRTLSTFFGALLSVLLGAPAHAGLYNCPSNDNTPEANQCTQMTSNGSLVTSVIVVFKNVHAEGGPTFADAHSGTKEVLLSGLNTQIKNSRSGDAPPLWRNIDSVQAMKRSPNPMVMRIKTTTLMDDGPGIRASSARGGTQEILLNWINTQIKNAQRGDAAPLWRKIDSVRTMKHLPNTMVMRLKTPSVSARDLADLRIHLNKALQAELNLKQYYENEKLPEEKRRPLPASTLRPLLKDPKANIEVELEPSFRLKFYDSPDEFETTGPGQWNAWPLQDKFGIKAQQAWKRPTWSRLDDIGLSKVRVAIVDTGASVSRELPQSTFVLGANYMKPTVTAENPPADTQDGHGTAIASIIAAKTDNAEGIAAVTWIGPHTNNAAELISIKIQEGGLDEVMRPGQEGDACTHDVMDGLVYAVDPGGLVATASPDFWDPSEAAAAPQSMPLVTQGASIINLSNGFEKCSTFMGRTLKRIENYFPKVLIVAAAPDVTAGATINLDDDDSRYYPASYGDGDSGYDGGNILVVTATDSEGYLTQSYGKTAVDIAAPGNGISVIKNITGELESVIGTSFAAPFVSGAAALLKTLAPSSWTYKELKRYLLDTSDRKFCVVPEYVQKAQNEGPNANVCKNIAHGLLDVSAATEAPIKFRYINENANGTITTWKVGDAKTVWWSAPYGTDLLGFCGTGGRGILSMEREDGSEPTKLNSNVKLTDLKFAINNGVPSLGLQSGEGANVRLRMQCKNSHLFKDSEVFKLKYE